MKNRLRHVLTASPTSFGEFVLSITLLIIGLWITSPWWETFTAAKSYDLLKAMTPLPSEQAELVWGGLATIAALLSLGGLLYKRNRIRILGQALAAFFWLCFSTSFLVSNIVSLGGPQFLFFGLLNLYLLAWKAEP